jgi:uncharacterized protein YacL
MCKFYSKDDEIFLKKYLHKKNMWWWIVYNVQGYVVLNRPWAFVQWLQQAHIEEEYVSFTFSVLIFIILFWYLELLLCFINTLSYSYSLFDFQSPYLGWGMPFLIFI